MRREVLLAAAARTPIGRFRGSLRDIRADHLGALVLNELLGRAGLEPQHVEDVVFGCVTQVGEQCGNIARTALLSAGWPERIPGMTVDRKCGSSEAAVQVACGQIAAGVCDVVAAGGAESMSRVPMGGNRDVHGPPFGWKLAERFELVAQGEAAERVADRWGLTRTELDEIGLISHRRAATADDRGYFEREIVPVPVSAWSETRPGNSSAVVRCDETIRRDTSAEKLAGLKPSFRPDGRITAGNSSQIADGAAAILLMSREATRAFQLRPKARIRAITAVGSDPTLMLTGPVAATQRVLQRAGLTLSDIDLFEVNEAFASVPLMWLRETRVDPERLNVNGGAIALGHPLGATGARILTTLVHELERRDATFGLQAICCAGGMATATIVERLS
ncbi:MAG: thiolase family protein [Gammaproteobacteria bacterium]|nr:thiolase family protein [Gammaproteobacteria bacterium]